MRHSRYDFQGHPRSGSRWGDDLSPLSGLFFSLSPNSDMRKGNCYRYMWRGAIMGRSYFWQDLPLFFRGQKNENFTMAPMGTFCFVTWKLKTMGYTGQYGAEPHYSTLPFWQLCALKDWRPSRHKVKVILETFSLNQLVLRNWSLRYRRLHLSVAVTARAGPVADLIKPPRPRWQTMPAK